MEEILKWLFGNDVKIIKEEDITLSPYYEDDNIYYTEEIYQLFQTKPLKREAKIMQLGSEIFSEPNVYHTRLEHSKGAYRNCLQFLSLQYKKPEWRKYIEENNLKGYLVEKLKFMCIHDIGHAMFSHTIEKLIGDENCTHEDIGNKIIKENEEVKQALEKIKADEKQSNLEGDGSLEAFCEGNIDFDRMDYLARDVIYVGEKSIHDLVFKLSQMCDLSFIPEEGVYRYVYRKEALKEIEEFLKNRDHMYKTSYYAMQKKIAGQLMKNLVQSIMQGKIKNSDKLKEHLKYILGKPLEEIDINEFLETTDISFLNPLLSDINQIEENPDIKSILPNNKTLLQIAISLLDPQNTSKDEYTEEEKEFIANVRNVINNRKETPNIQDIYTGMQSKIDKRQEIQEKINAILENQKPLQGIYPYKDTFKKYDKTEAIYIKDEIGKIYKLDEYPNLKMDLSEDTYYGVYIIIPELKQQGISDEKINAIKELIQNYQEKESPKSENNEKQSSRMNMLRTVHGGNINYSAKLDEFFGEENEER